MALVYEAEFLAANYSAPRAVSEAGNHQMSKLLVREYCAVFITLLILWI